MVRTRERPFSDQKDPSPKIGIFCRNEAHRKVVAEALQIDAFYFSGYPAMAGHRFEKIIFFMPETRPEDAERLSNYLNVLRMKILPGGKLHVV